MTYTFRPGTYTTRDGRKAVVLCDDAPGNTPLKGYIVSEDGNNSAGNGWTANGHMWPGGGSSGSDLLPPVKEQQEVVRWAYLWRADGSSNLSARMAMDETTPVEPWGMGLSGHQCVARTRVVLTPGRFDAEDSPSEYDRGWNEAIDAAEAEARKFAHTPFGLAVAAIQLLRRPS